MRDLSESVYDLDLIDGVYRGRETAMDAEYLVVDDHTKREEVEHVCEVVPHIGISIFSSTFSVETVRLSDAS